MPIIASFFGIYVRMYFADHGPPHIHVEYQGHEALVVIADGEIVQGKLPRRAHALVRQWCLHHRSRIGPRRRPAAVEPHSGSRQ